MTAQFKVGAVYFNGYGDGPWRVMKPAANGLCGLQSVKTGARLTDSWRLGDGRYMPDEGSGHDKMHLLPGELHNVNGQWVPVAEEAPKTTQSCFEDMLQEVWERAAVVPMPVIEPSSIPGYGFDAAGHVVKVQIAPFSVRVGATEKKRPALTWATPKPVDRWEGYAVKRFDATEGMEAPPAHVHPLQRITDPGDPLHGSAWLKVR